MLQKYVELTWKISSQDRYEKVRSESDNTVVIQVFGKNCSLRPEQF